MFVKDEIKFVENFSGIIDKSTPHLYLSALPFAPSESIVAKCLLDKFPGIAKVVVGQHHDWPKSQGVLQQHSDTAICTVAFSLDGRHIASGSDDSTVQLWDVQIGSPVGNPLQGHTSSVLSVTFSPDGRYIASGSYDRTIQLWDAQTGGQVGTSFQGHTSSVNSIEFSPDGRYMVSGSNDRTIRLWDTQTGAQVGNPLQGHTSSVNSVAFSPDGRHIVSGSNDRTIQLWNAQTSDDHWVLGNSLQGHTNWVTSVAFSPDGRHIVSGSDDRTIRLWDAQTGSQVGSPLQGHTSLVKSVAFSPDGGYIVSSSYDRTIQLWDVLTGDQVGNPLQGHTNSVSSVAFSPDGKYFVSSSDDGTIRLWNAQTSGWVNSPLQRHYTNSVLSVAFSLENGNYIVSGSSNHSTLQLWNAQMNDQVGTYPLQGYYSDQVHQPAIQMALQFKLDRMMVGNFTRIHQPLEHENQVSSVAKMSLGERHIVSNLENRNIPLLEAQTGDTMEKESFQDKIIKCPPIHFSSSAGHALCNAQKLFLSLSNVTMDYRDLVYLQDDGWIVGPRKRLLLWIPSSYHSSFSYTPWTQLILPRGAPELDLNSMAHGSTWYQCYLPTGNDNPVIF